MSHGYYTCLDYSYFDIILLSRLFYWNFIFSLGWLQILTATNDCASTEHLPFKLRIQGV